MKSRKDLMILDDLPQELIGTLYKSNKLLHVLSLYGGCLNTNEMAIGVYKEFGEIWSKQKVHNAITRLKAAERIVHTKRKGEYKLTGGSK